jgi:PAS domain S-box-containing protein
MIADITDSSFPDNESKPFHPTPPDAEGMLEAVRVRISQEPARLRADLCGRVTEINPAFSVLCGYTFEEIRGLKPGSLLQGPETTTDSVVALRSAIAARQACSVEMVNYHKNQSTYRVQIDLSPIFNAVGEIEGFEAVEWRL